MIDYVHPREDDPSHPRIPMPLGRRFRSYVGLSSTARKLDALLSAFPFTTVRNALDEYAAGTALETVHLSV